MKLHQHTLCTAILSILLAIGTHAAGAQEGELSTAAQQREQIFLSLDEALSLALQNNLDISIEKLGPEISREGIAQAESVFDANSSSDLSYTVQESEDETSPVGIGGFELSLGQRFHAGSTYQLGLQLDSMAFDGSSIAMVPASDGSITALPVELEDRYGTQVQLTLAQPVLRNFGTDVNTTQIRIAQKNYDISLSQFHETVIDVVSQVQLAYWDLFNALANLRAERQSLQLAYDLLHINEAQVKVGALAPIEVLQAKAQVASREVNVTTAELTVLNAEDQVKRLLNFSENDPIWGAALTPTDSPIQKRYDVSLDESIRSALSNREQLQQVRKAVSIQEIGVNFSENQILPELNLIGAFGFNGVDDTLGDSLANLSDFNELNVTIGAQFRYPLGNRGPTSDLNAARLALDQSRLSQRKLEQTISVEVRVTHRNVTTAYELIGATRVARELAEEQLEAEQQKFGEGLSTNFQVLDYQDKLTQARTREALAITSYNQALTQLNKAIGMTLQQHNIVIGNGVYASHAPDAVGSSDPGCL